MIFILYNVILIQAAAKIAIIGCGIGGATLGELLPGSIIFESHYQCGGRINHYSISDQESIELGATFYIKENKYVNDKVKKLNLTKYLKKPGKLGVFKNKQSVFESSDSDLFNIVKMVYNYGFSPKKLKDISDDALNKFLHIYEYLEDGKYFNNYQQFLSIIGLSGINLDFNQYLKDNNIDQNFQEEFVDAILLAIYNQKNVTTISGLISMIAAFSETYSIKDGNRQLINHNDLNVIYSKVENIKKLDNGQYLINNEEYEYVIIANLIDLDTQYYNIKGIHQFQYQKNQKTYVYIIAGKANSKYFGSDISEMDSVVVLDDEDLTELIVECQKCYQGFNIYKIQGRNEIKLEQVFETYQIIHKKIWNQAYPEFSQTQLAEDFELDHNFFYLNSIESLASCMEMVMIQAKNIANIIKFREAKKQHDDL